MDLKYNQCLCPQCGGIKTFGEKVRERNKKTLCHACIAKYGRKKYCNLYTRTCIECGKNEARKVKFTSNTCQDCSRKLVAKNLVNYRTQESYGGGTSYTYFCRYCNNVRTLKARRVSANCSVCSKKYGKGEKIAPKVYFDFDTMAIYMDIPTQKKKKIVKSKKQKPKKIVTPKKQKTKKVSKQAIEKQIELNRKHKAEIAAKQTEEVKQVRTDEEMIAAYLATNTITVCVNKYKEYTL